MKNKIYVPMAVDFFHEGHAKIIKIASRYGKVIIGLLTDKAIAKYKSIPVLDYGERYKLFSKIKKVQIYKQEFHDYKKAILDVNPTHFLHADDWKFNNLKKIRSQTIKLLNKNKIKLIEPKFTEEKNIKNLKKIFNEKSSLPERRQKRLSRLLDSKFQIKAIESHNPISGIIAQNASCNKNGIKKEFDAIWSSSLTDSVSRGKPDNQSVDYSTRINGLSEIMSVTTKPVIFDLDNGGRIEHLPFLIKSLDRLGVSACIIEDKTGLKRNSLFKDQHSAQQDTIKKFTQKIKSAVQNRLNKNFLVIARIESFILGKGLNDCLKRARSYKDAGADCLMIHSKEKHPKELFQFSKKFLKGKYKDTILVAVPSTFSSTKEEDLAKNGYRIVIYANQLLRASYLSMLNTAVQLLKNSRAYESDKKITSIKEILKLT
jgi:phosphoenolpyruvate mutase